jgi:glycosyltransferase involved in cell wall biosynthesis
LKILHILSTPRAEGTPNLVLDWLATGRHEQEVFVLNSQPADLTDKLRASARWYEEADYFSLGVRKFTGTAVGVRRVCRERRPDLLVCWPTGFANWVCLGARLAGVEKMLVHCGNPPNRSFKSDWMSRYSFWPLRLLGANCVCCSNYVRRQYQDIPLVSRHLFHTVWNCARVSEVQRRAADARAARPDGEPITAIMVATLERHKDHATLLRAVPAIRQRMPQFRLRLAGDGKLRQELERLATELGVADAVEFLGMRRDVPELLGHADLFVFSTTPQEGLGTVLVEALAAGLPVVASDVPACRELLQEGTRGRLVAPANQTALSNAIISVLEQEVAGYRAPVDFLSAFGPEVMMNHYMEVAGFGKQPSDIKRK